MSTILLQQQAQTYSAARTADSVTPPQTLAQLSQPAAALILKAQAGQSYRLVDSATGQLVVAKSIQRDGRRVIVELDNDNSLEIDDFFTPEGETAAPLELITGTSDALCPAVVTPSSMTSAASSDSPVVLWTAGQASELCLAPMAVAAAMTETVAGVAAASAAGAGAAAGAAGAGLSAGWLAAAGLGVAAAAAGGGGGSNTSPAIDPKVQALQDIQNAAQNNSASNGSPSLATYSAAGVTGVTANNLTAINNALNTAPIDGTHADTTAEVQALVDSVNRILAEANGSAPDASSTNPNAADYANMGASIGNAATDPENLALLNSIVGDKTAADVSNASQINALAQIANTIQSTAAGDSTAPALTVADLTAIGLTGVTADNLQAITQVIAAQADDGSDTTSVAQLQAIVQKVNDAQTAITTAAQDNTASHSTLPLSTYTDAGVSGVTADSQTAIETALNSAAVQGIDVNTTAQVQALVDAYKRILAEANGSAADTTPDPSAADYTRIGVTGVDSAVKAALLSDAIGDKTTTNVDTVAKVQTLADAVSAVMAAASATSPNGPTLAQLQALGLTSVTADNLAGVQQALANTVDDGSGVDSLAELQALVNDVNAAASTISAAAQDNNATATTPTAATYATAGVTGVTSDNLATINNALNSAAVTGTSVDTPAEIQALVNSYNAILAEANGSAADATPTADPTAADYSNIGVTGVDSAAKAALLGDVIGNKVAADVDTVAEVQTLANAVSAVMSAAAATTPTGPTLAELQTLGIAGVTAGTLSAVQQAIANTANDGTGVDTVAELQAVVDGVISPVSAISNAAQNNSATVTSPSVATYANAGVTGVTSGNLAAVNDALNSASVVGTSVDTTAEIQTLVNSYATILAEANGSAADATPTADPTAADYNNIGVTAVDSAAKASLLGDVIGDKVAADVDTVAEVQTLANAVSAVMTAAAATTPTGPTLAQLQALGMTGVTADNLAAVQKAIAGTADDGTGADTVAELQALINGVNSAVSSISSAAQANNATATTPSTGTYATAGVTGVNSGNLAAVNDALNSASLVGTSVDTTAEIQILVNSYAAILAEANGSAADATPTTDPSAADYTRIGVTGVDSTAKAGLLGDVIGNKVTADVDTVAEVQTLANAVNAVMTAAAATTPTGPTLAELQTLGIAGVTAGTLNAVQQAIANTANDGTGVDTVAELQAVVDGVIAPVSAISNAAQNNSATATSPNVATYANASVTGVTNINLAAVNDALNSSSVVGTSVDTTAKIQTLVNSYNAILGEANGPAADATPTANPSATDYANIGADIGTASTDAENLALLNDIVGGKVSADVDTVAEINALAVIANAIELTAAGGTPSPALTVADFQKVGLTNVSNANLANVLASIAAKNDNGTETDSLAELQAIVNASAPNTTVSTLSLSNDSGLSNTDFVTQGASQTITGTLSTATLAGEKVQISLDNGSTWVDTTQTAGTNTFSLATTLTSSSTLQARVVDARGNAATAYSQSYTFDTTAPTSAVDLDSATGTQATSSLTVNAGDWQSGVHIAANVQAPTSTDICALQLTLGGAGLQDTDHLVLGSADFALNANNSASNVTLGGVTGLNYSYNSSTHVLTLTQAANAAFDPSKVDDILQSVQMRSATMADATPGDRTVTIAYQDLAGNNSTSATSTVSVIPVAQMSTVNLIQSQLSSEAATGETVTAYNNAGSFYFERNSNTNWNAQNTWAQSKTYDAADGSTQQMHLVHINTGAESSALRMTPNNVVRNDSFFMGVTDWNKDGTWEYSYSGNSQANQVSQAFFQKNNATDTTPWGNYSQWNSGEPGTDPVETISAVSTNGGWIDWAPANNNNADGMAELEYSRVLNLAKTSNHGSIDVASSTAGTAYLVKSTATVTNVASITGLADSQWNSVAVGSSGILNYEDFTLAPKGWTDNGSAITTGLNLSNNYGLNGTLGRFGNTTEGTEAVSKTYTGLPASSKVWIEFDMLEMDNWQGQNFNVYVNGVLTVATQYFGTGTDKDAWDGGIDMGDLSNSSNGGNANTALKEEAHHYAIQATTDANGQIKLGFGMSTSSTDTNVLSSSEASWAVDNMMVRSTAGSDSSSLSLAGLENGTYVLYTADANGNLSRNVSTTVNVTSSESLISAAADANNASSNTVSVTTYADAGVTGVTSSNLASMNDALNTSSVVGTSVDTTAKIQTLVNSYNTILAEANGATADATPTTNPSATDYANIGANIGTASTDAENLALLNDIVGGKVSADVDTIAEINALAAIANAIELTAAGGTPSPALTVADLQKAGLSNVTSANLANVLTAIAAKNDNGTETDSLAELQAIVDTSAPNTTVSTLSFSNDSGLSNTDFNTHTAAQTVTGTLSGNTLAGDNVQISLDNGSTWVDATHTAGTNTFSLSTTLTGDNTMLARVVDARGNAAPAFNQSYVYDTTAPTSAVDLDSASGTQASSAQTVNAGDWQSGVHIAANVQAPTSTDIRAIQLTLGGDGLQGTDHLLLDGTDIALNANSNASGLSAGGVGGLSYSYNSSTHVLTLTQAGNAAFDPSLVDDILQSVQMRSTTMADATPGDRTVTIAYQDLAGNNSTSATSTVSVIPVAQMSTVSLIASQLSTETATGEAVTADNTSGSFYFDRNSHYNWSTQNTWALGKTYDAADGSTQQMHLVHINSGVESAAVAAQQSSSADTWNYFMGATDWDNDGTWNYTYGSANSNLGASFYNRLATGSAATPWGNYSNWNNGEPNGGEQVATITRNTGGWFDWSAGNTADAIAELEYSRVLNLAKSNSQGSIDVASSTAGTAYLVKSTATITNEASITSLADSQWNSVAVGASGILRYEDFTLAPKGWADNGTAITTSLNGTLGRFGNTTTGTEAVSKTYTGLPASSKVWIEFDMLEMDNWQGQTFNVYVNSVLTVATQYFGSTNVDDAWDGGVSLGDASNVSNGGNANTALKEEAHHYAVQATTDANGHIQLGFGMSTSSASPNVLTTDEASWSVDNMTIRSSATSDSSSLSLAGLENGSYVLYTSDANGHLSRNMTTTVLVEPANAVKTLALSADTGSSNTDFVTNSASQTISGTLSANTLAGEKVQISLDHGSTWLDATNTVGTNTFSLATTLTGSNTLQARFVESNNNPSASLSQAYVLDTTAPSVTASTLSFSADTGSSSTDRITQTAAQTITGTLSGNTATGDTVQISMDNGSTWTNATHTAGSNTFSYSSTLSGSNTAQVRVVDVAGNTGNASSYAYVLDNTAPTVMSSTLSFSADTGNSASDLVTNTSAQTITGTLSGNTATGDTVQISMDNGSTWTNATHTAGSNTFSYSTTLSGSNTAQVRVVDVAGNMGNASSYAYVLDTTAPTSAVDLDSATGTQATSALTVNASDWANGVTIAPALQAPTSTDIRLLKVTLGGAGMDNTNDHLLVGSNDLTLGTSASGSNQTIGGVTGLSYSYDSSTHVLSITQAANAAFDPTKVDDILQSLKLKSNNMDTASIGEHTATFTWSDLAGNDSTSATATISVIPVAQVNSVSLIQSQLVSGQTAAETVTADSANGSFYVDRNFAGNYWADQQSWANNKSLTTANSSGNTTMHLVHANTLAENSALYNIQNNNTTSTVKGNFFLGATDNNVDGVWDWQFTTGTTQAFYNKNSVTDTTPFGGYINWASGEPSGGTETIAVYNMNSVTTQGTGTWYDWGNSSGSNLDAIAELEYARVLNLTKTTTSAVGSQSLEVASSTTGTAYLVNSSVTVTNLDSITSALGSKWNSVAVTNSMLSYEDFNQTPTGWTYNGSAATSTLNLGSSNGLNSVLGRFTNTQEGTQTLSKTYALGLASTEVWVEFDMIEMDAWKGQNFNVFVNGTLVNSAQYFGSDLTSADAWDGGIDLGNLSTSANGGNSTTALKEEAHHYALKASTDSSGNLVLGFGMSNTWGGNLVAATEASFGIDNVMLRKTTSASLSLAGLDAGTYQLYTADANGHLSHNYSTGLLIG